jgi:hypothetical protein
LNYNRLLPNAPKTIDDLQKQWEEIPIIKSARKRGTMGGKSEEEDSPTFLFPFNDSDEEDYEEEDLATKEAALNRLKEWALRTNNNRIIKAIGDAIDAIGGREELYLNDNRLTDLPAEIGQLTHLQELYLDHNQLTELPAAIGQLTNLQDLYLHDNLLRSLPAEIGQLTNLQVLNLNRNELTELPAEIGQLTNLQGLYLNGNNLTEIPQLTELPADIGQLTNLQDLYLDYNQSRDDVNNTIRALQQQWKERPITKSARKRDNGREE